ncbi:MAG: SH3 domain-containing protein [Proteobacteria bacterium]|nr:SH3 domain-containing protein [Pseudomonadota bacterium]
MHNDEKKKMLPTIIKNTFFTVTMGLMSLHSTALLGATVEAKKDGVEVFASAGKDASVLATLKKGQVVDAGTRSGMYWQVKTSDGKSGFVSVLAVKVKADAGGGLNDAIRDAVKEGRNAAEQNGARSRSAVMGVRGLDENNTAMAGSLKPDLRAVYEMEDRVLPQEKLDQQSEIIDSDVRSLMIRNH